MRASDFKEILQDINCEPYRFDIVEKGEHCFLVGLFDEACVLTGKTAKQSTRKWYLSPFMSKSEFVQTCLKCVLTSAEHEAREAFEYKGKRVFGPHCDVDALLSVCEQINVREPVGSK